MIRPILTATAATLLLVSPALGETRTYDVAAFTGIDVSSGIDVLFTTGSAQSVVVKNDKGDFDDIKIAVNDGQLVLSRKQKNWITGGWKKRPNYQVTVTAPALDSIDASSGADVSGRGLAGERITLSVSSGAGIQVEDIAAGLVSLESSSGSELTVSGSCDKVVADSSSGSGIDASGLRCQSAEADASSGSTIGIFASQSVTADASSGADVDVYGNPVASDINKSSGGSISIKS